MFLWRGFIRLTHHIAESTVGENIKSDAPKFFSVNLLFLHKATQSSCPFLCWPCLFRPLLSDRHLRLPSAMFFQHCRKYDVPLDILLVFFPFSCPHEIAQRPSVSWVIKLSLPFNVESFGMFSLQHFFHWLVPPYPLFMGFCVYIRLGFPTELLKFILLYRLFYQTWDSPEKNQFHHLAISKLFIEMSNPEEDGICSGPLTGNFQLSSPETQVVWNFFLRGTKPIGLPSLDLSMGSTQAQLPPSPTLTFLGPFWM